MHRGYLCEVKSSRPWCRRAGAGGGEANATRPLTFGPSPTRGWTVPFAQRLTSRWHWEIHVPTSSATKRLDPLTIQFTLASPRGLNCSGLTPPSTPIASWQRRSRSLAARSTARWSKGDPACPDTTAITRTSNDPAGMSSRGVSREMARAGLAPRASIRRRADQGSPISKGMAMLVQKPAHGSMCCRGSLTMRWASEFMPPTCSRSPCAASLLKPPGAANCPSVESQWTHARPAAAARVSVLACSSGGIDHSDPQIFTCCYRGRLWAWRGSTRPGRRRSRVRKSRPRGRAPRLPRPCLGPMRRR